MKVVNVSNGNYKVTVQDGGVITLNTGTAVGTVIITGDLTVLGTTTTVDTANMTIEDNIIFLNKGELGSTVTEGSSGIQIDRGSSADPEFVWDESVSSFVPSLGTVSGTWVFRRAPGTLSAIQTQSINTNSGNLYLISSGSGGYITVSGTANYERNILTYVDTITYNPISGVSVIDDDRIPNIKAVFFILFKLSICIYLNYAFISSLYFNPFFIKYIWCAYTILKPTTWIKNFFKNISI